MKRAYGVVDSNLNDFRETLENLRTKGWTEESNDIHHLPFLYSRGEAFPKFKVVVEDNTIFLEFYRYEEQLASINTRISAVDGSIIEPGYQPLFVRETQLLRLEKIAETNRWVHPDDKSAQMPILWTTRMALYMVIIDRIKQFLKHDQAYPGHLEADIKAILRRIERKKPQHDNPKAGRRSRIVLVPSKNGGPWGTEHNPSYPGHPGHALGDGFRKSASITPEGHDLIKKYFVVAPASEKSGSEGVYVCFDETLQKLRGNPADLTYSDIGYEVFTDKDGRKKVASLFVKQSNVVSRHRSMNAGDGFVAPESLWDAAYEYEDKMVFKRFHNYLKPEAKSSNKDYGRINMLVAFGLTNPGVKELADMKTFFDTDKNVVSNMIEGADGCISISPEVAKLEMIRQRTIRKNLQKENFTVDFFKAMEQAEREDRVFWPDCKNNPIAHYEVCPDTNCQRLMIPITAQRDVYQCTVCGCEHTSQGREVIYNHDGGIHITGYQVRDLDIVDEDLEDSLPKGLEAYDVFIEVQDKVNCSRIVSSEGVKGMMVARNQDYVGYVQIPELGEGIMPLDGILFSNSNKSDRNGIAVALTRLEMVIKSRLKEQNEEHLYDEIEELSLPFNKIFRSAATANKFLKENVNVCKRTVYRSVLKDGKLEMIPQELYVGIVQIKVTEAGAEFSKVREREVKFTHQLCTSLHLLGKDDLRRKVHKYSLDYSRRFSNRPQICDESIMMLYGNSAGVPQYVFDDIKDMELAVATVQSYMHIDKWRLLLGQSPLYNDIRFKDGFTVRIPFKEGDRIVRFPSKKFIESFEGLSADDHIFVPEFIASQLRLVISLQSKNLQMETDEESGRTYIAGEYTTNSLNEKIDVFERNICKAVVGKKSVIARLAAFSGLSQGGKQFGCEYLPTGVAVINDLSAWKKIGREAIAAGLCTKQQFSSGELEIYGFSIRDPQVWSLQACSVVKLWSVHKANDYFWKKYGIQYCTFEQWTGDPKAKALYWNPVGVTLNVLDMIYLNQSDADGDYIRNYPPLDPASQKELALFNKQMENYDFINPYKVSEVDTHYHLVKTSAEWHHRYTFGKLIRDEESGEVELEAGETTTDKHDFPVEKLVYTPFIWDVEELSDLVIKGIKQKTMIASVTTSQWKLIATVEYLLQTGEIASKEIRDKIIFLYQSEFLQDGCIRLMKHEGALDAMTIDKIGKNEEIMMVDGEKRLCQEEIQAKGSHIDPELLKQFFYVCRRFVEFLGFRKDPKTGRFKKVKDADTSIGQMLLAYTNFGNGSRSGLLSSNKQMNPQQVRDFLKSLTTAAAAKIYHREMFNFVLPTILLCNNKGFIKKAELESLEEGARRRILTEETVAFKDEADNSENNNAVSSDEQEIAWVTQS